MIRVSGADDSRHIDDGQYDLGWTVRRTGNFEFQHGQRTLRRAGKDIELAGHAVRHVEGGARFQWKSLGSDHLK